ncbi:hypothetical protein BDR26DRAFT_183833 [Obelidium mucronatum]|nr:hypothetical protein BDR26DRAFT_183833 [Obelidium mucronatum]
MGFHIREGYDWSQILVNGNCYNSYYTIGTPVTLYNYSCAPHFYCPNSTAEVIGSLPQLCEPTNECVGRRLATELCEPNGPYEPQLCVRGNYCPDSKSMIPCPEQYWCPTGTITPRVCPTFSLCPEGTVVPKYYGGLIFCGVVDAVLILAFLVIRFFPSKETRSESIQRLSHSWSRFFERTHRSSAKVGPAPSSQELSFGISYDDTNKLSRINVEPACEVHKRDKSIVPDGVLGLSDAKKLAKIVNSTMAQPVENQELEYAGDVTITYFPDGDETSFDHHGSSIIVAGRESTVEKQMQKHRNSELQPISSSSNMANFVHACRRALEGKDAVYIDFRFENLGLRLSNGKSILKGVNGSIKSKKLTAIMGPSGCGSLYLS